MNKKQYNNVIDHTLKYEQVNSEKDNLASARAIFKNLGVALPQGDIKTVCETIKTDNYMGWKSCTMEEAQAAADEGVAAIGINDNKIVVLAANDEEAPITENESVIAVTQKTSALSVSGLQFYSYSYGGSCGGSCSGIGGETCSGNVDIGNYNDRYTYELVQTFGFTSDVALLIRSLYDKVDNLFPSESNLQRAWKCSRLLGGIVYGNDSSGSKAKFKWRDVAGQVFSGSEATYFVNTLGYTTSQYSKIKNAIGSQHDDTTTSDFAHMQITLSARLAYKLNLDGFASNIGTFSSDENVSYLAGWLGDATLKNDNGVTSFGNDDYCADLDAENIYRKIILRYSSVNALNSYYSNLSTCCNRADIFLNNISYNVVKEKVFYELVDKNLSFLMNLASQQGNIRLVNHYIDLMNNEQYHWDIIKNSCPDTYNFLKSVQNRLPYIVKY